MKSKTPFSSLQSFCQYQVDKLNCLVLAAVMSVHDTAGFTYFQKLACTKNKTKLIKKFDLIGISEDSVTNELHMETEIIEFKFC